MGSNKCGVVCMVDNFFHSARIHRYLSENGKSEKLINSLLRGNLWRAICWSIALFVSWYQY